MLNNYLLKVIFIIFQKNSQIQSEDLQMPKESADQKSEFSKSDLSNCYNQFQIVLKFETFLNLLL
jgi:hypothetical protein